MTVQRNGRISQLLRAGETPRARAARPRSARAQGLRTLQHQSLPRALCQAIDTEVWFRGLLLETAAAGQTERRWATKDQVYDEALGWFLERQAEHPLSALAERALPVQDLTFWVDSRLLERARRLAARHGIKLAQLIEHALTAYVQRHVPEALLSFRRRTQQRAVRLYERQRPGRGTGARAAPVPTRRGTRRSV